MSDPTTEDEIAVIRKLLKAAGLRSTSARIAVLQRLRKATSPMTHAELAEELVPVGFDKATVFRNLTDLTEANLVARTELGDRVWRFEVLDPNDPAEGRHPHFVCVDCGQVNCMSDIAFDARTLERIRELGRVMEILLKGRCHACESSI